MRNRNWFWGIIFILAALLVIAGQTNSFEQLGLVTVLAALLLVAIIVQSIIRLSFFGIFIPLAFLYAILQKPLGLAVMSFGVLIVAGVFLSIGFGIIFKKYPSKEFRYRYKHRYDDEFGRIVENTDDNNPCTRVSFGSSIKYLHGDAIKSAQFYVSFGSLEIYFDQAKLAPEGAEVFIDCSFGAVKMYVPKDWRVIDNLHTSLGVVENNAYFANRDENSPKITLVGNVQLGGVEIKYI